MADHNTREVLRCLHSLTGQLEAICEHMPVGPDGAALRAVIEGGMPEILTVAERVHGAELERETASKSFARGYQVTVLMRREEETGVRDPEVYKQDPDEFMAALAADRQPGEHGA